MVIFDDDHLAYWERSKKQALENLGHDKRVCVIYANFKAQRDGVLDSGFLRFYGKAELHESGSIRDNIFNLLLPREQTHVGADTGIGVLIKAFAAAVVGGFGNLPGAVLGGLLVGIAVPEPRLVPFLLIWISHIGLDRMLGYGLKYPTQFRDTHLQHV